jgi:transcriptional regulator with XRE-family HTH domain
VPTLAQFVARNIRLLRESMGYTREDLAYDARVSTSYVEKIERGRKVPTLETIELLADGLRVDPGYLFQELEPPAPGWRALHGRRRRTR